MRTPKPLRVVLAAAAVVAAASRGAAVNPGTEVVVPAAARVSPWLTDLYIFNPGDAPVEVTVGWLVRAQPNPSPQEISLTLSAGHTEVLEDVILGRFGHEVGVGAFEVNADAEVVVNSRIYNRTGELTFGQGFAGVPWSMATEAGETTHVVGLVANAAFRTNIYAVAGPDGATFTLSVRDPADVVLAERVYTLGVLEPFLGNVLTELGSPMFDHGTLRVDVSTGVAVVGASRVDELTDDPTTLESWWPCSDGGGTDLGVGGTYFGVNQGQSVLGGFVLEVADTGVLERVDIAFSSDSCGTVFAAASSLTHLGLTVADLADGVVLLADYGDSRLMEFTITAAPVLPDLYMEGQVTAVGSGWTGDLVQCNGEHPANPVFAGRDTR